MDGRKRGGSEESGIAWKQKQLISSTTLRNWIQNPIMRENTERKREISISNFSISCCCHIHTHTHKYTHLYCLPPPFVCKFLGSINFLLIIIRLGICFIWCGSKEADSIGINLQHTIGAFYYAVKIIHGRTSVISSFSILKGLLKRDFLSHLDWHIGMGTGLVRAKTIFIIGKFSVYSVGVAVVAIIQFSSRLICVHVSVSIFSLAFSDSFTCKHTCPFHPQLHQTVYTSHCCLQLFNSCVLHANKFYWSHNSK